VSARLEEWHELRPYHPGRSGDRDGLSRFVGKFVMSHDVVPRTEMPELKHAIELALGQLLSDSR
jgi:hypothetical protein